jgi:indolepyruvate ferredoxin oxidoreductase beta subunit
MAGAGKFDIYVIGVGGQGIGLLSEVLMRAADHAGHPARAVDTHGLAQRGGTVISHVRLGAGAHAPLIQAGQADLVVALERHEALRGLYSHARDGGALIYYDAVWQPARVRLQQEASVTPEVIDAECSRRGVALFRVLRPDLPDARMQNVAVLGEIAHRRLMPGVEPAHFEAALGDLLDGSILEKNLTLFRASQS